MRQPQREGNYAQQSSWSRREIFINPENRKQIAFYQPAFFANKKARQYKFKQLITLFFRKKISFSKYLYVSLQLEKRKMRKNKKKKQYTIMGQKIQYAGLALIIIAAIILIISYFAGWNNINAVNVGSFAAMVVGLIVYIVGGKRSLNE